jgi:hypothetical protein
VLKIDTNVTVVSQKWNMAGVEVRVTPECTLIVEVRHGQTKMNEYNNNNNNNNNKLVE